MRSRAWTYWMILNKCLNFYIQKSSNIDESSQSTHKDKMNLVFANSSKDDAIYPLTVPKIADAQKDDNKLSKLHKKKDYSFELIDSVKVLCKDGKLVVSKNLQNRAI